jgi:ubiquinone/menaquinone biosynthesis C-methylase UbiE
MTLADIGAGEGVVAFRAIERVGASLQVVLTDISAPMLRHAETLAVQRGVRDQCTFLECSADKLGGIGLASLDVVATRASLAYVSDKKAAFSEFYRVLKPGGRISLAEPIFQDEAFHVRALKARIEAPVAGRDDRFVKLLHRWRAAQFPDSAEAYAKNPLVNFSERDLANFARAAGFTEIHLELHIDVMPSPVTSWEVFVGISPHPWAPPLSVILADRFTSSERQYFESILRPQVESGSNLSSDRVAYLNARKPAA